MLGRPVGSSLLRLPLVARIPLRPSPCQCQHDLHARLLAVSATRLFATRGRPKKAVGEPSKPVKRAVKRTAKSPTASAKEPAKQKLQAKKKSAAPAKKKPAKPKKRTLTEEQKTKVAARSEKNRVAQLKKAALSPPSQGKATNAYAMLLKDKMGGVSMPTGTLARKAAFKERAQEVQQEWKHLSPAGLEHYNHLAVQRTEANAAEYKRWVESHTPEEIQKANRARKALRRLLNLKKGGRGTQKWNPIRDERAVKPPLSAYLQFTVNRHASGDFRNIALGERAKLIAQEWKALSESEKKKYKDLQNEDQSRYQSDYKDVYGHVPPGMANGVRQAAAAAA